MRRTSRSIAAVAALAAALAGPALIGAPASASTTATAGWTPLAPAAEPEANPLKGFIPFQGDYDAFPHSMEWAYFPVNAVMTGPDTFDWTAFDQALDDIASRGHQTALRFYLDYPTRPSGVPQYLLDAGLATHPYDDYDNAGVSVSPDYDDPALLAATDRFIAALGARYDGDPRVGFLQAGLVGFWGEWHTYPYNGTEGQPDWMASEGTQREILTDFVDAFHETELEVRNPDGINAGMPIGYHDDSFALTTKTSSLGWHFMDNMVSAGATEKWKQHSIGGELRPELQSCIFSAAGCDRTEPGGDYDFAGSLAQTHASWMMDHYAFATGYSAADKPAALAASQSLGYSFRATEALAEPSADGRSTEVGMTIENVGVAPFYYDWPIELQVLDSSGATVRTAATDWHVSDIASGSSARFTTTVDTAGLPAGAHTIVAQVVDPLPGGMPIRFANATQDADRDGWLTLASVDPGAASAPTATTAPAAVVTGASGSDGPTALGATSVRAALPATGYEAAPLLGVSLAILALGAVGIGARRATRRA